MKESKCKTCRFCKKPESFETIDVRHTWTKKIVSYWLAIFCSAVNIHFQMEDGFENYPYITECTGWKPKKLRI